MNLLEELNKDEIRAHLLPFLWKVFKVIPSVSNPQILDIGCGSGVPSIELAKLSGGTVIGIDIDQPALTRFETKIRNEGLTGRVQARYCSMMDLTFPDDTFDIIWAEGSINFLGFENGLRAWWHFLKPGGWLAVHDQDYGDLEEKTRFIIKSGYTLVFTLPMTENDWQDLYFTPLKHRINHLLEKYCSDLTTILALKPDMAELEMVEKNPAMLRSIYYLMRKIDARDTSRR